MGGFGGGFGGFGGAGGFEDISDIFSSFFGGGFGGGSSTRAQQSRVGEDIQREMTLSFMDAAKGCKKSFSYMRNEPCAACRGTGAKNGTEYSTCGKCQGKGVIQQVQNTMFGRTIRQSVCPDCNGDYYKTKPCTICKKYTCEEKETVCGDCYKSLKDKFMDFYINLSVEEQKAFFTMIEKEF
jgi:molecular chaperone DnaJ